MSFNFTLWTQEEDDFLVANYKTLGPRKCGDAIGRSHKATSKRASILRLSAPHSGGRKGVYIEHACGWCGQIIPIRDGEECTRHNRRKTCSHECRMLLQARNKREGVSKSPQKCDWDKLAAALELKNRTGDHSLLQRRLMA